MAHIVLFVQPYASHPRCIENEKQNWFSVSDDLEENWNYLMTGKRNPHEYTPTIADLFREKGYLSCINNVLEMAGDSRFDEKTINCTTYANMITSNKPVLSVFLYKNLIDFPVSFLKEALATRNVVIYYISLLGHVKSCKKHSEYLCDCIVRSQFEIHKTYLDTDSWEFPNGSIRDILPYLATGKARLSLDYHFIVVHSELKDMALIVQLQKDKIEKFLLKKNKIYQMVDDILIHSDTNEYYNSIFEKANYILKIRHISLFEKEKSNLVFIFNSIVISYSMIVSFIFVICFIMLLSL